MADPSVTIPPNLLAHVHLLSSYKYPYAPAQLHLDTVVEYLSKAPAIVREHAPVAWTYLTAPSDGSVLLVWRGGRTVGRECATDGYVWAEPELRFANDTRGYTIEICLHESGFAPTESVATHRRVRYRLTASPPGSPHDPSLELIHYYQSAPEHRLPARNIPVRPETQKKMGERAWLERAGGLPRKEFMLHDAGNWPTLGFPGTPGAAIGGAAMQGNPYQQQQQQRQTIPNLQRAASSFARPGGMGMPGPSPSKRARQLPPVRMPSSTSVNTTAMVIPGGVPDLTDSAIADEEAAPLGDAIDMLTPQDISATRYAQHHEWMDAIVGSGYSIGQLIPVPLNIEEGMAELAAALLDTPGTAPSMDNKPDMAALTRRLQGSLDSSKETLAAMTMAHEAQVAQYKSGAGAVYARLERELAALSPMSTTGGGTREKLDVILREVEMSTGLSVVPRENVRCVRKGGLKSGREEEKQGDIEMELGILTSSAAQGVAGNAPGQQPVAVQGSGGISAPLQAHYSAGAQIVPPPQNASSLLSTGPGIQGSGADDVDVDAFGEFTNDDYDEDDEQDGNGTVAQSASVIGAGSSHPASITNPASTSMNAPARDPQQSMHVAGERGNAHAHEASGDADTEEIMLDSAGDALDFYDEMDDVNGGGAA